MTARSFVFGFKKQFAPAVEQMLKRQTIRANRKDGKRPVPGDKARLDWQGMRAWFWNQYGHSGQDFEGFCTEW